MPPSMQNLSITNAEKLAICLGIPQREAEALLRTVNATSTPLSRIVRTQRLFVPDISAMTPAMVAELIQDPERLQSYRLNPNRVQETQLQQFHQLEQTKITALLQGRPYYTLEELRHVTALPGILLQQLFRLPALQFTDKVRATTIPLMPVAGRYILPEQSDLESAGQIGNAGYTAIAEATPLFPFRIVGPADFEAEAQPHLLKRLYGGHVYPVLRDALGFERYFVPGAFDLWFIPSATPSQCQALIEQLGLHLVQTAADVGYYRVQIAAMPADRDLLRATLAAIEEAQRSDAVLLAEPDQVGLADFPPDRSTPVQDSDFEADARLWNYAAIDLDAAHTLTRGSSSVVIFVIDSGCRMDHGELTPAFRPDWPQLDLNYELDVPEGVLSPNEEVIAHGTQVSGVICAQGATSERAIQSIAPACQILPIKISGSPLTPAYGLRAVAIRQALNYLQPGQRGVINISWLTNGEHLGIREALVDAARQNVAIVASAGNYLPGTAQQPDELHFPSGHIWYPADRTIDALCSVAATNQADGKASYSYYGAHSVTVAAPGGELGGGGAAIYTTSTPDSHVYTSGTSFSAPHVTGLLALLFALEPTLTPQAAIQLIRETAEPTSDATIYPLGAGRINAYAALQRLHVPQSAAHTIVANSVGQGTVTPQGEVKVMDGADQSFNMTPDAGFQLQTVTVDAVEVGALLTYTVAAVHQDHHLIAHFVPLATAIKLNINQATREALMTLPYIGPWLAERIIAYRLTHGNYPTIWGLTLAGVSAWTVGQIADQITV